MEKIPYYHASRFKTDGDCNPTFLLAEEAISDRANADLHVSCIGASFGERRFSWFVIVYGPNSPSNSLDQQLQSILSKGTTVTIPDDFINGMVERYVLEDQKDNNLLSKPIHKANKPFSPN
ncbi:hypothetical protein HYW46_03635 [Candidatus Daviesbacteria bacterium]|nr:hypothetical protein [Candidatus Daviesbacteria bacterium]